MSGYYNQQPYGNYAPPFPGQQQSPPNMNYNAYNQQPQGYAQQQQYSPTGQQLYGMEPTTPVLDENQMNWFFNHVNNLGSIPGTEFLAQPPMQAFAPPPQPYASQYQYPQYGQQLQSAPFQQPVQPQAQHDVQMQDANQDDDNDSWPEEEDEYAPPAASAPSKANGTIQAPPTSGPPGSTAQGKRPIPKTQPLPASQAPFNPFKSQSLGHAPTTAPRKQAPPAVKPLQKLTLELRHKAGDAIKDFHAHGFGYSTLAQEPSFNDFDKDELKKLYQLYNVPVEPEQPRMVTQFDAVQGKKIAALKQFFAGSGIDIDDATLARLASQADDLNVDKNDQQTIPGLGPAPTQETQPAPPNRALSSSTPRADAGTPVNDRSAYMAKLAALKSSKKESQAPTQLAAAVSAVTAIKAQNSGASTPVRKAQINKEALQRKLQLQREAAAKKLVALVPRPGMPARTESQSSFQYEPAQVSGSDAENPVVQDIPSPEEQQELEEGEVDLESGEIVEEETPKAASTLKPVASIPGLPPKPPEVALPTHARNDSNPSAVNSPRNANLPPRPASVRKPAAVFPPAVPDPKNTEKWRANDHLLNKRPVGAAFGQSWNPPAKRAFPAPAQSENLSDAPEPVVIDISSEEDGELSGDEMDIEQPQVGDSLVVKPVPTTGVPVFRYSTTPPPARPAGPEKDKRALLAAKSEALKRQIQLKEAAKNSVNAAKTSSPLPAAPVARLVSSPAASTASRVTSASKQAVLKSLDESIKTDEDQMQELERQMEKLRAEKVRKEAQKAQLAEEIQGFGINPEGMSQQQMQEVRDNLVEEAAAEAQLQQEEGQVQAKTHNLWDESNDIELEGGEADQDDGSDESEDEEEGEVDESDGDEGMQEDVEAERTAPRARVDGATREVPHTQESEDIPEADDPRAVESRARVQIHNVPFTATKADLQQVLEGYDLTGVSLPAVTNPKKYKVRARSNKVEERFGYALVDFLYPAEAEQAVAEKNGSVLLGTHKTSMILITEAAHVPTPVKPKTSAAKVTTSHPSQSRPNSQQGHSQGLQDGQSQQERWQESYCRLRVSGLPERICHKPNIVGWLGTFYNAARDISFPIGAKGNLTGEMLISYPDEKMAKDVKRFIEDKKSQKNSKKVSVVLVSTPQSRKGAQSQPSSATSAFAGTSSWAPTALKESEQDVVDEDESSGSESDDEAESGDDDAMSVSEDGSEEGEVAEDEHTAQRLITQEPVAQESAAQFVDPAVAQQQIADGQEDSDSMSESGSSSDSEEDDQDEVTGNVGVSLQDVEVVPMEEDEGDGNSDSGSESQDTEPHERSDDEEGELEESAQQAFPQDGSVEDSSSGSEEDGEAEMPDAQVQGTSEGTFVTAVDEGHDDDGSEVSEEDPRDDFQPAPAQAQEIQEPDSTETVIADMPNVGGPASLPLPVLSPVEAPQTFSETRIEQVQDTEMVDDNDDDFYEPNTVATAPPAQVDAPVSGEEEDDWDPDFDDAFDQAFADADAAFALDGTAIQPSNGGPNAGGGNGGIPGSPSVSKHQEEEEEEADLSEDGEILSDDDDESFKSIPPLAPARFKSLPPPPVLERPKTPIEYDVPMWKPLGVEPQSAPSTTNTALSKTATSAFKPYTSVLRGFKSRASDKVQLNLHQPLCPAELAGEQCVNPRHCPGQHVDEIGLSGE